MKTFTRWLLALLLVAMPMMAAIQTASANSELVPASRLVAPYVTNGTGSTVAAAPVATTQATFLILTSVAWTGTGSPGSGVGPFLTHLEFYDKDCTRTNRTISLSRGDTDQFNVTTTVPMATGHGWVDIDVRSGTGSLGDPSVQQNVLVGTVLIADATNDYAFSYPMAASVGSSTGGAGLAVANNIVTRNASGNASAWSGRYEPFPTRVILPAYFAEQTASPAITGFLAVASPADGNWDGDNNGEAPGNNLNGIAAGTSLLTLGIQVWDGCEQVISAPKSGHYLSGTLQGLFGSLLNRTAWTGATSTACTGGFPQKDELGGEPVGWIDIPNTSTARSGITNAADRTRGLVGVFFETSLGTGKLADASRLWGDRSSITSQTGCFSNSALVLAQTVPTAHPAGACLYNIMDALGRPTSQP